MPFKHNAAHRRRIPQQKFRVKNWPNYDAGLRQRGSITFWISEAAIAGWLAPRRTTPGGQSRYSDLAIETSVMCGIVFHQPLRQTEGLMTSLLQLMGLNLPVPDHTTLSRRCANLALLNAPDRNRINASHEPIHVLDDSTGLKIYGAGQWLEDKHGGKSQKQWRKLHLGVDANTGEIIAEVLSDQNSSYISQLTALLDQIDQSIARFTADGAYDSDETYRSVRRHSSGVSILIPTAARNMCPFAIPNGWRRQASSLPSEASATVMTTLSPKRSTVFTRPRSSIDVGHGATSRRWSLLRWNGSIGSTTAASSSRSGTSRRQKQRQTSTRLWKLKTWPRN